MSAYEKVPGESDCQVDPQAKDVEASSEERDAWGAKTEYMLALIGYAVGIGNLWRFPYLCHRYGGGSFLIPYIIMLVLLGIPLFCLETSLGQLTKKGAPGSFAAMHKAFRGIGFAAMVLDLICSFYYNSIIMWILRYFFSSFTTGSLPWSSCPEGAECCVDEDDATMHYWYFEALKASNDITLLGSIDWYLFGTLIVAWIICFLCMCKGVESSGKVVYFTATFPYLLLVVLFFRGVTLPGAKDGILYYLTPKWEHLKDPTVWRTAATQIFYSLGIAFGSVVAYSSYNKRENDCIRDGIVVTLINCGTSIFGGFVIFSLLGYRAHKKQVSFEELKSGPGLAFIAITDAIGEMSVGPLWSVLFFFMLFLLGLDSQFGMLESLLTSLKDEVPFLNKIRKEFVSGGICLVLCILAIPMSFQGGLYIVDLLDMWSLSYPLLIVALFEIIVVSWVYGVNRFCLAIKDMIGYEPNIYFKACWLVVCPLVISVLIVSGIILSVIDGYPLYDKFVGCNNETLAEQGLPLEATSTWVVQDQYPGGCVFLIVLLNAFSCLMIPGYMLYYYKEKILGFFKNMFR
ncbi:hypothetical protein ACHWQZ_G002051 [Mnemiopsis leidyi]